MKQSEIISSIADLINIKTKPNFIENTVTRVRPDYMRNLYREVLNRDLMDDNVSRFVSDNDIETLSMYMTASLTGFYGSMLKNAELFYNDYKDEFDKETTEKGYVKTTDIVNFDTMTYNMLDTFDRHFDEFIKNHTDILDMYVEINNREKVTQYLMEHTDYMEIPVIVDWLKEYYSKERLIEVYNEYYTDDSSALNEIRRELTRKDVTNLSEIDIENDIDFEIINVNEEFTFEQLAYLLRHDLIAYRKDDYFHNPTVTIYNLILEYFKPNVTVIIKNLKDFL